MDPNQWQEQYYPHSRTDQYPDQYPVYVQEPPWPMEYPSAAVPPPEPHFAPMHQDYRFHGHLGPSQHVFHTVLDHDPQVDTHRKHRRSRRGCFTCRSRRVKCDETRPVCIRCQKASRDCKFPDEETKTKSKGGVNAKPESSRTSAEKEASKASNAQSEERKLSTDAAVVKSEDMDTPSLTSSKSSKSVSPPAQLESLPEKTINEQMVASKLDDDVRFYLEYYCHHLSYYHYGFNFDGSNFLTAYLPTHALQFEPLLYAVVAYAAYHHTVADPDGTLKDFLPYYSKSLGLLRNYLADHAQSESTVSILLTILQLAILEEFLGDWVNLRSHQLAAGKLLTTHFSPDTMFESEELAKLFEWYLHFELYASLMSGKESTLGREWAAGHFQFHERLSGEHPDDKGKEYEARHAKLRVLATDLSIFKTRQSSGQIQGDELKREADALFDRYAAFYDESNIDVAEASNIIDKHTDENPTIQPTDHDLWAHLMSLYKFWGTETFFHSHITQCGLRTDPALLMGMSTKSKRICKLFGMMKTHNATPGVVTGNLGPVGLASLVLSRQSPEHLLWYRRQLALSESLGYIYPISFRKRMTNMIGEDVTHWWLPDDELLTPIIRDIREFVQNRNDTPNLPPKSPNVDLRDMSGLFQSLNMDDTLGD
ncbi:MAG: hypothetical protein M1831_004888 [Alyxoria varia]|nr:MAG: hypothetical protein M1831_004888 [Alyxoria varia]